MVLHEFHPDSQTGAKFGSPSPSDPGLGLMSDWNSYQRPDRATKTSVRNYKVSVSIRNQEGDTYPTPLLSVSVESFVENGQRSYQAVWTADRTVFGFGDSPATAIQDMANFLVNDLDSLEEDQAAGLTPKAAARLNSLKSLFGVPV